MNERGVRKNSDADGVNGRVQISSQIETRDFLAQSDDDKTGGKYDRLESGTVNKSGLWDEVSMKKHGLVTKKGDHKRVHPDYVAKKRMKETSQFAVQKARTPHDEISMKHCGFVDKHAHHMTEADMKRDDVDNEPKDADRHVIVNSKVEIDRTRSKSRPSKKRYEAEIKLLQPPTTNNNLLEKYKNAIVDKENLINSFKFRQEYIEEYVGKHGTSMVIWNNGSKDVYELKGDEIRHVAQVDTKNERFKFDKEINPWTHCENAEKSVDSGKSERSPTDKSVESGKSERSSQDNEKSIGSGKSERSPPNTDRSVESGKSEKAPPNSSDGLTDDAGAFNDDERPFSRSSMGGSMGSGKSERSVKNSKENSMQENEENRPSAFRPVDASKPFAGVQQSQTADANAKNRLSEPVDNDVQISGYLEHVMRKGQGNVKKQKKVLCFKEL